MQREQRQQLVRPRGASGFPVGRDERARGAGRAAPGQVHDQEGEVIGDVERPQDRVELDAVDDLGRLAEEHVLGSQISVHLAHEPVASARVECGFVDADAGRHQPCEAVDPPGQPRAGDEVDQLGDVLGEFASHGRGAADPACGRAVAVELRQAASDSFYLGGTVAPDAGRKHFGESTGLVVAPHHNDVVERAVRVGRGELHAPRAGDNRSDVEIDVGSEASVQPDFLLAHQTPACRRAVVEERQHHRFLQLVGAVTGDEHERDVRLVPGHRRPRRPRDRRGERIGVG